MHLTGPLMCALGEDGARNQVEAARDLAGLLGSSVLFVHVRALGVRASSGGYGSPPATPPAAPLAASLALSDEIVAEQVQQGEALLDSLGVERHERRVAFGDPVDELVRIVREEQPALLVIGTRRRGRIQAAVLGSVSRELVRAAPCPIMVVSASVSASLSSGPVVCAIDHGSELEAVVEVAGEVARRLDRPLVLVHVITAAPAAAAAAPHGVVSAALDTPSACETVAAAALLSRLSQRAPPLVATKFVTRRGDRADEILRFADESRAALIVSGTRGRGRWRTALLGSVAHELARSARRPVVVVPHAYRT